jgi:putative membrane protein
MPRLFIYNTEANAKEGLEKKVLQKQFNIMLKRLWYGITWPSAILTLIFGLSLLFESGMNTIIFTQSGRWLLLKLVFVLFLYFYHFSLQKVLNEELKGQFKYSSQQLRMWNEVATIFLIAIVFLVVVKESLSFVWGLIGLIVLIAVLMAAIQVYKTVRKKS